MTYLLLLSLSLCDIYHLGHVVEFLLSRGADPSAVNGEGRTPAAEAEERAVVELLVRAAMANKAAETVAAAEKAE